MGGVVGGGQGGREALLEASASYGDTEASRLTTVVADASV
jgi:hypothetical protein